MLNELKEAAVVQGILKVSLQGEVVKSFGVQGLLLLQNNGHQINLGKVQVLPNGEF